MSNVNAAVANTADTVSVTPQLIAGQARRLWIDSIDWLQGHWLQILVAVAVATIIVLALAALKSWGKRYCERQPVITGWSGVFGRAIARTNSFFMVMIAAKLVEGYADAPAAVSATVNFLFTVAAVFQAAIWVREIVLGMVEARTQTDRHGAEALGTAMGLIRLLVTFAVFAIALIVVLDNLGVNVTGLVAGLGVGGIAIGLAAQGIFADLFAALSIIFDKPFRRGDSISYDTTSGSIEEIGLKSTRIRSFQGEERIISNKQLLDKEIQNNTKRDHRRAKFVIGVTYQTPPETCARIPALLQEIVEAHDKSFVRAGFTGFGASSLDFEVEFDSPTADYASFYDGRTAVGIAILKRFNDDGIEIAYPTQTTFTAAPDGTLVMPYPQVQPVRQIDDGGAGD
ncbi:mechanosensitive ion channel family protein [Sphingomonas baiyangensis]|uniref:Small-conductance mechanosensitive channel n=1 Tax=Sphingomonas baiyangensis TaxID=2572576 RepID=A0A4U1L5A8_9SPHN|nr:mechanosensitive ion channel family protein [Sphingomonas baiyangensis]TKD51754.1 mechanosensitive ion channel family protein [Sphingomonas baiyangensis]